MAEDGNVAESIVEEDSVTKRPQFGNRTLTKDANVFQHNAWYDLQDRHCQLARHKAEECFNNPMQKLSHSLS